MKICKDCCKNWGAIGPNTCICGGVLFWDVTEDDPCLPLYEDQEYNDLNRKEGTGL